MRRSTAPNPRSAVRRVAVVVMALLAGLVLGAAPATAAGLAPQPLGISVSNTDANVTSTGSDCTSGPLTETRRVTGSQSVPAGAFSSLPSQLAFDLPVLLGSTQAALRGSDGRVTLTNARGSLTLALSSGSCASPSMTSNGTNVSGTGTWTVVADTAAGNSYRQATGSGTFSITAGITVGGGRAWTLQLLGTADVLQPTLAVTHRAFWGGPFNYLSRTLSVEYRIRNTGPGDAFGVVLTDAPPTAPGITRIGTVPQTVGAVPAGTEKAVVVRYRVCGIAAIGCRFTADVQLHVADALDAGGTVSVQRTVQVPVSPVP
ncbi:hypothetical protein [Streptomyces sp. NBC_00503]|uniref:hypothetical protein n=1 Tax=Streptomyces sp. NBC_00503 TaxID=2903659 RepID=UPI002E811890|nr:hypothetical protein [Streptomyces sp. NBC_00503]WUD80534.1 hypothetical protein OG490_08200 [Streptomyces sp. NBC_00503]